MRTHSNTQKLPFPSKLTKTAECVLVTGYVQHCSCSWPDVVLVPFRLLGPIASLLEGCQVAGYVWLELGLAVVGAGRSRAAARATRLVQQLLLLLLLVVVVVVSLSLLLLLCYDNCCIIVFVLLLLLLLLLVVVVLLLLLRRPGDEAAAGPAARGARGERSPASEYYTMI